MSYWTYVNGIIEVSPFGRTQHEMRYILETVLDHLPKVTGSERNMSVHVVQKSGYNMLITHDEFGVYGNYSTVRQIDKLSHSIVQQSEYIVVLEGALRDRKFEETMREMVRFLTRFSKRLGMNDILVSVSGWNKKYIFSNPAPFDAMFESPSWNPCNKNGEPAWWEYLTWDGGKNSELPLSIIRKYYNDEENEREWERRENWKR